MSKRLSFSIAINLLTENFKKGANAVKNSLRSMQMQVLTFAAALGFGGAGLSGLLSRFKDVARETNRVTTALKNVSAGTKGFAENLRFLSDLAKKYGMEINTLTGNFAKFTAAATQANMPMDEQKKVFESISRACTAFGLSAKDTNSVFVALSQMMGKGKISSEELRKQMGEKLPVALQAMAKAAGVSMGQLEKLLKQGKLMSSKIIPEFAEALNEMIPNVDTDNLETSLNRLRNTFTEIVNSSGFQEKYKALIDGLRSLLETASQNIQNITVLVTAAIAFIATNAFSKVWKGWWNMASEMTTGQKKLSAELVKAETSRISAFNALETARLQHSTAVGKSREKLAQQVALKEVAYAKAVVAEDRARIAFEKASTSKRVAMVTKGFNTLKVGAAKLMVSLKAMWNTFAPAAIVSAIIALYMHFRNLYKEAQRIKNIFSDYRKEADRVGNTQEILMLEKQLSIMNDKAKSHDEINAAQKALNKMLGTEITNQDKLIQKATKRVNLLKEAARADFFAQKVISTQDNIKTNASSVGLTEEQVKELAAYKDSPDYNKTTFYQKLGRAYSDNGVKGSYDPSTAETVIDKTVQDLKVLEDAQKQLKDAVNNSNQISHTEDLDDKAKRAAERRLEAQRKLEEEKKNMQIENQKFALNLQQKSIDTEDDSFAKRIKQTRLNLEKEKLAIEEVEADLLKKQTDFVKTYYVSLHGTNEGFEPYFAKQKEKGFKQENGDSILPEGLRPEDIAKQVNELTEAARKAQDKGLKDINKDLSAAFREQEVMFSSDLDKKLSDLDAYYDEQVIKAQGNDKLIAEIEANRRREKHEATVNDHMDKLDFEEQLKIERLAGMESIGMTELVEEKKLEITKEYLRLRITALQALADAGNESAKQEIKMYQAILDNLNTKKPVKGLKALADKAIFDAIKNGFMSVGDSAEEAERKTIKLLSAIAKNAGMIAGITSELQSMFGGMNDALDTALETVGNLAKGFEKGMAGGIMAMVTEGIKLYGKASEAAKRHRKALKEIEDARLAAQRAYNLLLMEQNLLMKESVSIFGEKQITRAANAMKSYRDSLGKLKKEMQGESFTPDAAYEQKLEKGASSPNGILKKYYGKQLDDYRKQLENYNKGVAQLGEASIVTGHKRTGWFGWGKGKDIYSSILDVYDDVLDKEGKLNVARIQTILDTHKMSDETRNYLEHLLDLQDAAQAAQEELRNYLQSTFGALGEDIMTSLENAIRDKGIDAWEAFGEAGAKVIESLGKQLAYELFFADKFQKVQTGLEELYGSGKTEEQIAREAMEMVGNFHRNIGSDMEKAQAFMEHWQKEAEKNGFDVWKPDDTHTQDSTKGYSVSMDQDTGGAILGRITGVHESILEIKSMMSAVNVDTAGCLAQSVAIGDELKKHTGIFYEMQQMQMKSYRVSEKMNEGITALLDIKEDIAAINKNTKGLAPRN